MVILLMGLIENVTELIIKENFKKLDNVENCMIITGLWSS